MPVDLALGSSPPATKPRGGEGRASPPAEAELSAKELKRLEKVPCFPFLTTVYCPHIATSNSLHEALL
jgi:hypothetical protein